MKNTEESVEQVMKELELLTVGLRYVYFERFDKIQREYKKGSRLGRATKEVETLIKELSHIHKQLYNIDRYIKKNLTACLLSPDEDIRRRAQQLKRQKSNRK